MHSKVDPVTEKDTHATRTYYFRNIFTHTEKCISLPKWQNSAISRNIENAYSTVNMYETGWAKKSLKVIITVVNDRTITDCAI